MSIHKKNPVRITDLLKRPSFLSFIKYLLIGGSSFILDYTLFYALYRWLGLNEIISNTIALFLVFWYNFLLNRYWSFKSKSPFCKQLLQYSLLLAFNMSFSNLFIYFTKVSLDLKPQYSKIISMVFIVLWNFLLYKHIIFHEKHENKPL